MAFEHDPHPRTIDHFVEHKVTPSKVKDERVGINGKIGLFVSRLRARGDSILDLVSRPWTRWREARSPGVDCL